MSELSIRATYIGGPTVLIEAAGLRFLTDPTFDPAGTSYATPVYTLHKTMGPALSAASVGTIDAVLLSHDHHFDNLDRAGRALLPHARHVIAPVAGADRLRGGAIGLAQWQSTELHAPDGRDVRITATPARHGPRDGDRGPVIGFLLTDASDALAPETPAIYISGDTVRYEGLEEIASRADIRVAFLFMGAARVAEVGPAHLTLTADEGVSVAESMPHAVIVPLHCEGWQHFSQGRDVIQHAFDAAGLSGRLRWLGRGAPTEL